MTYEGEQLTHYQREVFDVEVEQRARRRILVDGSGTAITDENPLPVKMDSDIQIGAVEIKDGSTDNRVVVKNDGIDNAMVVTQNSQPLPIGATQETTLQLLNDNVEKANEETVTQQEILNSMLKELKKITLHLSIITDTIINNSEVE